MAITPLAMGPIPQTRGAVDMGLHHVVMEVMEARRLEAILSRPTQVLNFMLMIIRSGRVHDEFD